MLNGSASYVHDAATADLFLVTVAGLQLLVPAERAAGIIGRAPGDASTWPGVCTT